MSSLDFYNAAESRRAQAYQVAEGFSRIAPSPNTSKSVFCGLEFSRSGGWSGFSLNASNVTVHSVQCKVPANSAPDVLVPTIYRLQVKKIRMRKFLLKQTKKDPLLASRSVMMDIFALNFLRHPNILQSLHVRNDVLKHTIRIFLEPTITLEAYVTVYLRKTVFEENTDRAVPFSIAKFVASSVFRALAYLERRGFVHGDVVPKNVLVSHHGNVLLGNFESARYVHLGMWQYLKKASVECKSYLVINKASPFETERAWNSDVWQGGLLMLFLLTGDREVSAHLERCAAALTEQGAPQNYLDALSELNPATGADFAARLTKPVEEFFNATLAFVPSARLPPRRLRQSNAFLRYADSAEHDNARLLLHHSMMELNCLPPAVSAPIDECAASELQKQALTPVTDVLKATGYPLAPTPACIKKYEYFAELTIVSESSHAVYEAYIPATERERVFHVVFELLALSSCAVVAEYDIFVIVGVLEELVNKVTDELNAGRLSEARKGVSSNFTDLPEDGTDRRRLLKCFVNLGNAETNKKH